MEPTTQSSGPKEEKEKKEKEGKNLQQRKLRSEERKCLPEATLPSYELTHLRGNVPKEDTKAHCATQPTAKPGP